MEIDWWNPDPLKVSTWNLLPSLGFVADEQVRSDEQPGLSIDFGKFKVAAGYMLNLHLRPIVQLSGHISTSREFCEIWHELPNELESVEQGKALLAYYLGHYVKYMAVVPPWLEEGMANQHLLPWILAWRKEEEARALEYSSRPRCTVERDWLRVALKKLSAHLDFLEDGSNITFVFDGSVLIIRCKGHVSAMPGTGTAWNASYSINVEALRQLPKRLNGERIDISIGFGALWLGQRGYGGVIVNDEGNSK